MYLGNIPATSFEAVKKDRFTGLTGTGVTLSHSVSNVQDIVVWVNNVKQDYNNYTVSGTSLTLGGSLVSADVVQVLYVGRTLQTVNPSADSVTASQIADNAISEEHLDPTIITGLTALASEPDDTDEFLVSDAGTLKRIDYSLIKGGGITVADNWRLSADDAIDSSETDLDSNWERVDSTGFGTIGSAMTQSSGIFTFPSTGIYFVRFQIYIIGSSGADYVRCVIRHYDGSSDTEMSDMRSNVASGERASVSTSVLFDCQNTSNDKIRFYGGGNTNGNTISGNTSSNLTSAVFLRLGDT